MTALWIAHVTVTDPEAYARYAVIATEAITAHGGVFLARGGRYVQLEGQDRPRNVVARFPNLEAARSPIGHVSKLLGQIANACRSFLGNLSLIATIQHTGYSHMRDANPSGNVAQGGRGLWSLLHKRIR